MTPGWLMSPHFLLRSTGFPVELLEAISCPVSAARADAVLDADEELADRARLVQEVLAATTAAATAKVRRKCFKRVARLEPSGLDDARRAALDPDCTAALVAWDVAVADRHRGHEELRQEFAVELRDRRAALTDVVTDPRFEEAVWLSSPQMWQVGLRGYLAATGLRSDTRRAERQLVAYLQRFCAKNDTSSFFGPIDYGYVAPVPEAQAEPVAGRVRRRAAFLAHWAVTALARAAAADPEVRPWLRPAHSSTCLVRPDDDGSGRVRVEIPGRSRADRKPRVLPGRAAAVLGLVDGERTVIEIAAALRPGAGADGPTGADEAAEVLAVLDRLAAAGIVRLAPEVPVAVAHPSRWLADWLAALPEQCPARGRWSDRLAPLLRTERTFAAAAFDAKRDLLVAAERRFGELTGMSARRGGGELYADRTLYYEEAVGGATPLVLDPAAADLITRRLGPVLDLYAAHALAAQREVREEGCARLAALAAEHDRADGPAGDRTVPLAAVVSALRDVPLPEPPPHWADAVREQLHGREGAQHVDLDPDRLPRPDPAALAAEPLLTSLDLMLVARSLADVHAGRFELVVGECHDQLLVWGWPLYFHDDPDAVREAGEQALRHVNGGRTYGNVVPTRRVKVSPFQYPGPSVTLGGVRPDGAPGEVPIAAVSAEVRDGRPTLSAPGTGAFGLHNAEQQTFAHRIFAPPRLVPPPAVEVGPHTPRLRIGGVVVQRERWRLRRSDLFGGGRYAGDDVDLLLEYRAAARRHGLPRHVFARVAGDRKPMVVDATSWFSLQALHHLVPEDRDVVLTEMLPGPQDLWLRGATGRHCAELRMTAYYDRGAAVGSP